MKVKSKFKMAVVAIVAIFAIAACAGIPATQKGKYAVSLSEFVQIVQSYNIQYKLQTPETQLKWKTTIDPVLIKVNMALDAWGAVIGTGVEVDKQVAYTRAFSQLKTLLITLKIIEIKE